MIRKPPTHCIPSISAWMASLVFMALVVISLYLNAPVSTIPQFLEPRFDRRTRDYFAAMHIAISRS